MGVSAPAAQAEGVLPDADASDAGARAEPVGTHWRVVGPLGVWRRWPGGGGVRGAESVPHSARSARSGSGSGQGGMCWVGSKHQHLEQSWCGCLDTNRLSAVCQTRTGGLRAQKRGRCSAPVAGMTQTAHGDHSHGGARRHEARALCPREVVLSVRDESLLHTWDGSRSVTERAAACPAA